jgi:hypothetical protein
MLTPLESLGCRAAPRITCPAGHLRHAARHPNFFLPPITTAFSDNEDLAPLCASCDRQQAPAANETFLLYYRRGDEDVESRTYTGIENIT